MMCWCAAEARERVWRQLFFVLFSLFSFSLSHTTKQLSLNPPSPAPLRSAVQILPHRYPFLLVDKVVAYTPGVSAVGVKSITLNEPQFTGHFPGRPILPGVLQVEALAQLAGVICLQMDGADPGSVFFFAGVDGVKWKRPVVPGDSLVMEVEIVKWNKRFGIAKAKGRAYVDGAMVVDVKEMTFALAK